jgi:hypothetical protein
MNRYLENKVKGELWMREVTNKVSPAYNVLSALYLKYENINPRFYSELVSNKIMKFDMFNDVVYLETEAASFFEKFIYEDSSIRPYNQLNLINVKKNINDNYLTNLDYWYDERKRSIYFGEIYPLSTEIFNGISFHINFKKFNCFTGTIEDSLKQYVKIQFIKPVYFNAFNFEYPKLTYNADTKTFNLSLVSRISGTLGLMSVNIMNTSSFYIEKIDAFFPHNSVDLSSSETYSLSSSTLEDFINQSPPLPTPAPPPPPPTPPPPPPPTPAPDLWIQLGNDINGESALDTSGHSVSMNAAGNRLKEKK